ncbi:MAG: hypothetical protein AAF989_01210, partial [Planctomycetota bacterium]
MMGRALSLSQFNTRDTEPKPAPEKADPDGGIASGRKTCSGRVLLFCVECPFAAAEWGAIAGPSAFSSSLVVG